MKNDLPEYTCPLCHSSLESDEYNRAIGELRKKVSETYCEENKKAKQEFDQKLEQINKSHKQEIDNLKTATHHIFEIVIEHR